MSHFVTITELEKGVKYPEGIKKWVVNLDEIVYISEDGLKPLCPIEEKKIIIGFKNGVVIETKGKILKEVLKELDLEEINSASCISENFPCRIVLPSGQEIDNTPAPPEKEPCQGVRVP